MASNPFPCSLAKMAIMEEKTYPDILVIAEVARQAGS